MFVSTVTIDDVMTGAEETYAGAQVDLALVEGLIRRLDGVRHTTVTLAAGDSAGDTSRDPAGGDTTSTGKSATGKSATGNSATGNSATGNSPTGNSPTGNSPTGNSATGNSPTRDSGDGARMAVGGHASAGLVVYETDGETFHILTPGDVVAMAAGRARGLVGVDQALKAAREFAVSGRLAPGLVWQRY